MLANLSALVAEATAALDDYDYSRALQRIESFFWDFCDNYVELVKPRRYGARGDEAAASANAALQTALDVLLRLFAPFVPFATEEVWSWWRDGSVHRASWPSTSDIAEAPGGGFDGFERGRAYAMAVAVSAEVRKVKSAARRSPKAVVSRVTWQVPGEDAAVLAEVADDLRGALAIDRFDVLIGPAGAMTMELEPETSDGRTVQEPRA